MKKKKLIGEKAKQKKGDVNMALWGSSVRSRSRPPFISIPKHVNLVEIPGEWELLPAARMTATGPTVCRVLLRKSPEKFENSLKPAKRAKRSA